MANEAALQALARCRQDIDAVDVQILELLNKRTEIVETIGQIKQQHALPVYEPKREDEVYQNVQQHNRGPLPGDAVKRIFERIIDEMRTVQKLRMAK